MIREIRTFQVVCDTEGHGCAAPSSPSTLPSCVLTGTDEADVYGQLREQGWMHGRIEPVTGLRRIRCPSCVRFALLNETDGATGHRG